MVIHHQVLHWEGVNHKRKQVSHNFGLPTAPPLEPFVRHAPLPTFASSFLPPFYSMPHLRYCTPSSAPYYNPTSYQDMHAIIQSTSVYPFMSKPRPCVQLSSSQVIFASPSYDEVCMVSRACGKGMRTFFRKCAERLTDFLRTAREHGERPSWITEDIWPKINKYWASSEFHKKCTLAKAGRASDKGGSVHTGGSISMETHRRRLREYYLICGKRPVSQDEVFEEPHMKKLKDDTKTWIEPRAERTYPINDQGRPIQPSQKESIDMWLKEVSGVHKGRVYGLESQCSFGHRTSGFMVASPLSSINQDLLELLHKKLAEINDLYLKENAAREKEAKEREEEAKRREEEEKRRRKEEERRREEEERRRKEEERRKENEFRRVTGDVEYLKSQLKSLLAFVLSRFLPPSGNEE
ncbi:hypothetical protein HAX54_026687 [Datura stramonium]|uniref:Uncharacterized protein n=1 Tax=Datura stramonium TaxID=4076 RepID=A0ABS8V3G5_DATST|nr:hypothetical protein [Datura stramonium]